MFNISSTKRRCPSCIGCEQSAAKRDGRPKKASTDAGLSDVGISFDQFSRWQKLAAVPEEIFERQMQDKTHMPTIAAIYPATPWAAMTRSSLAARCGRSICSMAMPWKYVRPCPGRQRHIHLQRKLITVGQFAIWRCRWDPVWRCLRRERQLSRRPVARLAAAS